MLMLMLNLYQKKGPQKLQSSRVVKIRCSNIKTVAITPPHVCGGVTIYAAVFGGVYFGGGDTSGGGA